MGCKYLSGWGECYGSPDGFFAKKRRRPLFAVDDVYTITKDFRAQHPVLSVVIVLILIFGLGGHGSPLKAREEGQR